MDEKAIRFSTPSFEEWKKATEKELKGKPFDSLFTSLSEGITLQPLYLRGENYWNENRFPGFYDYRRGSKAGRRKNEFLIVRKITARSSERFNERLSEFLDYGVNVIAFDIEKLPFEYLSEFEEAFKNIRVDKHPWFVRTGDNILSFYGLLFAFLRKKGIKIEGSVINSPLADWARDGIIPRNVEEALANLSVVMREVRKRNLNLRSVEISTLPFSNAGCNMVQEIGIALAQGVCYANTFLDLGVSPEVFFPSFQFTFGVGPFFFGEIAKFRAARILWNLIQKEYGASEEMFIHAQSTHFNKTFYDPYVNVLRTTAESFSAVVGEVNSIELSSFDFLSGFAEGLGEKLARNATIILTKEAHIGNVLDPAGGSFFVEKLTDEIAEKSLEFFKAIQRKGGYAEALRKGFIQDEIRKERDKKERDFLAGKRVLIGINKYANPNESFLDYAADRDKKKEWKDGKRKPFVELKEKFNGNRETFWQEMEKLLLKGASYRSIEEVLETKGENLPVKPLPQERLSARLESLRKEIEEFFNGKPCAFLFEFGSFSDFKFQADFARRVLESGGFCVRELRVADTLAEALKGEKTSEAAAVVFAGFQNMERKEKFIKEARSLDVPLILSSATIGDDPEFTRDFDFVIWEGIDFIDFLSSLFAIIKNNEIGEAE